MVTVVSAYEQDMQEKIILSEGYEFLKPLRGELQCEGNTVTISLKSADAAMFYISKV